MTALTATQAVADIARGAMSAEEYTSACLDRIEAVEGDVQAFVQLDPEHALAQARALDAHKASGGRIGPLHGIPVGIKDIFDTADFPTECGSPILAGRRPETDAAVVARLREAGAVIIGKTVTTEFAYFHPGKTRNPRDMNRTPGGSSSGSAAAVAAGMVPLAIGSQTNGSMIRPAAFCGVFGVKPSHGLISRAGALTLSRTLDHVGAFARSIEDLALILDCVVGQDPADPDTRPYAAPAFRAGAAEPPPLPPSFALVRTPMWDKADADARNALEDLARELNAREVDLPDDFRAAWPAQRAIMAAEMAHNLGAAGRPRRRGQLAISRPHCRRPQGHRQRIFGGGARCAASRRGNDGNFRAVCRCHYYIAGAWRRSARDWRHRRSGVLLAVDAGRVPGAQFAAARKRRRAPDRGSTRGRAGAR